MNVEIRCEVNGCNALFGKIVDGVLIIKNRDLERHFDGGVVWGPCRKCGSTIRWTSNDEARPR